MTMLDFTGGDYGRYYRGARAKGTDGTAISPPSDHEPAPRPIQPATLTGERPPTTSTMCWRDDHALCTSSGARCDCACHGPDGQVPTPRPENGEPQ